SPSATPGRLRLSASSKFGAYSWLKADEVSTSVFDGTLSRSISVRSRPGASGTPGAAPAGAAEVAAGAPGARAVRARGGTTGAIFGLVVRVPASGVGAITVTGGSSCASWAGACDGRIDKPTAITEPATEAGRFH